MHWEKLWFLRYEGRCNADLLVSWAIDALEAGHEEEEIVQLASLDLFDTLDPEEAEEAFQRVVALPHMIPPTKEEAARAHMNRQLARLVRSYDPELVYSMADIANRYEIKDLQEATEQFRMLTEAGDHDASKRAIREWWNNDSARGVLRRLIGKRIEAVEWTGHLILELEGETVITAECPWRFRADHEVLIGNTDMNNDSRLVLAHLRGHLIGYPIKDVQLNEEFGLFQLSVRTWTLDLFHTSGWFEGWSARIGKEHISSLPGGLIG